MNRRTFLRRGSPLLVGGVAGVSGCLDLLDDGYYIEGIRVAKEVDLEISPVVVDMMVTFDDDVIYEDVVELDGERNDGYVTIREELPNESGQFHIDASTPEIDAGPLSTNPGENRDQDCFFPKISVSTLGAQDISISIMTHSCEQAEIWEWI